MSLLLLLKGGEAEAPVYPRIAVTQEHPPDRMAVRVSDPATGRTIARLADDEGQLENVIERLSYSSEMQGGCKTFKGDLARDPRIPWSDLPAYADLTVYGDGVEELWWGRVDKDQGAEGDRTGVELNGVGHIAALEDDKACLGLGFIDADLSKWGEPSVERRKRLIEAGVRLMASASVGFSSADAEAIAASILHDFTNVTTVTSDTEAGESHYDSGGVDIGALMYATQGDIAGVGASANWESNAALGRTDTFTTPEVGTDHDAGAASNQTLTAPGSGYRFARIRNRLNAASEGESLKRIFAWQAKVLGDHGLTLQGTWPDVGYTAKQMLGYAIPRYSYLSFAEDSDDDEFIIPHAWFSEPGDLATIAKELTKYGLLDWFIYGGKQFQLRRPGTYGRFWQAAAGPAELKEAGLDANRLWREIVVAYQGYDGKTHYAGPLGSGANVEDAGLEVTDPDHPAVRAGITRRDLLVMKNPGDARTAVEIGGNWLSEANELSHAGECNLSDYVLEDKGIFRPSSHVKAGDFVRFQGRGPDYRKIVAVEYVRDERKAICTLDAPSEGLAALEERFGVELKAAGLAL